MSTNTAATTTTTNNNDVLADFALQVFERARQLQHERTGLLSNRDARNRACMEYFTKALSDINNVIAYTKLFGGDSADEQIKSMVEFASTVSNSKEASAMMQEMLEKKLGPGNLPGPIREEEEEQKSSQEKFSSLDSEKEKDECIAP